MIGIYNTALAAGLLAAGLASIDLTSASGSSLRPMTCGLRAQPAGAGLDLMATASASQAASGSYRLTVTKRGEAGGANVEQSGNFSVGAGGTSSLSTISMSMERGATYDAVLTVRSQSGQVTCSRVLPSSL